jgi:hypothetical protein
MRGCSNRRQVLQTMALLPFTATAVLAGDDSKNVEDSKSPCVGTWEVASGMISFIVSIEPQGDALCIWLENGSSCIHRVKWKPMPGGALVMALNRVRMWTTKDPDRIFVEQEDFSKVETTESLKQFPTSFCMSRAGDGPNGNDAQLPAAWKSPTLPVDWASRAGKRSR